MVRFIYLILNYQTYQETIRLVNELLPSLGADRRVIIVDNASPNNSFSALVNVFEEVKWVEILKNKSNDGFSKGNNFGLRYAKKYDPEFVCIINNDVHFDNALVDRLANKYYELPDAGVISPIQLTPSGEKVHFENLDSESFKNIFLTYLLPWTYNRHSYFENSSVTGVQSVFIVPGAFLFSKYDKLSSLGFFYEGTFLYCEESFLGARVEKAGLKNYIVLGETYIHDHGKTINSVRTRRQQQRMIFEGRLLFAKEVRKDNVLKICLLHFAFTIFQIVDSIKQVIKRTLKTNN